MGGISEVPNLKVTELMTRYVLMAEPEMSVLDSMRLMLEKNFRCVFIVRMEPYKELGLVTRFDIMKKVIGKGLNPLKVSIAEIMEKKFLSIAPNKTAREASRIMGENQVCHLAVKSEGKIIGVISSSDIFEEFVKRM
ncbi:MAG: cyclic nucleotide-binding/CBS domain-containing protein [Candidatus Hydrothermarchaeaceae archaeon]